MGQMINLKHDMATKYRNFVRGLLSKRHNYKWPDEVDHGIIGLSTEAAELLDLVKKKLFNSRTPSREQLLEELGGCEFYLSVIYDHSDISREEAIEYNIDQLNRRYPDGYSDEAAIAKVDKNG